MALKEYKTVANGMETTFLLDDAEAARLGLKREPRNSQEPKAAVAPANKAAKPAANK